MSNLIDWSDQLSVGIEEIDQQHRVLVGMLNELHEAIHQQKGSDASSQILKRLTDYTLVHFSVEEGMMRLMNYPQYEEHKAEHDDLIEEIQKLRAKLEHGQGSISFELLHFLKVWLTKHIQETDRQYTPHFLSCGNRATLVGNVKKGWMERVVEKLFH